MAEEKQYQEEVTVADNSLSHQQTSASHGLHHDHIAEEAIGGRTADLGKSYYTSMNFIGTVIVGPGCTTLDPSNDPGYLSRPNLWIPWMGSSGKHDRAHQRSHWSIREHHLGGNILDSRLRHRFHSRRPSIGHFWTTLVLHRLLGSWSHWQHSRCKRTEY